MESSLYSRLLVFAFVFVVHSHPICAANFVVSPQGNDHAKGDDSAPLRTIGRAAQLAKPGDTVLVRAGVYRERVTPPRGGRPGKPITYHGEQLGRVFVRGSDVWQPDWTRHNDTVSFGVLDETMFVDDVYLDSANPFRVAVASTPHGRNGKPERERFGYGNPDLVYNCGQVFVGGQMLTQVPFLAEVESQPDTWTFDAERGRIYIHFGRRTPSEQMVEITTRRRIFAPHVRGLGHIVVEGFIFEHCGNQYPTNFWNTPIWAQAGALGLRGGPQRIDHNVYDAAADDRVFLVNSACDKPSPWSPDEFLDLVHQDLGGQSPGLEAIDADTKAALTLDQWRVFWRKHGLANDVHSVLKQGMHVTYAADRQELTVVVPFDPGSVGSTNHDWIDNDYWNEPVPQDGLAIPGPFQNLKPGKNVFRVWDGLPLLAAGQLPGRNGP